MAVTSKQIRETIRRLGVADRLSYERFSPFDLDFSATFILDDDPRRAYRVKRRRDVEEAVREACMCLGLEVSEQELETAEPDAVIDTSALALAPDHEDLSLIPRYEPDGGVEHEDD